MKKKSNLFHWNETIQKLFPTLDMVCTYCGRDHSKDINSKEGIDFVFEENNDDAWCICVDCKKHCDEQDIL